MTKTRIPFIAYHPTFKLPLPEGHRFPMIKYELLPEQLIYEGIVSPSDFFAPEEVDKKILALVHDKEYLEKLFNLTLDSKEIRRMGFPLTAQLIERELRIVQGTITAAIAATQCGIGFNIAGGTHHAGSYWGEGFCLLNDQAIAAAYLTKIEKFKQILIIDLDVHQGNGTAEIFKNDTNVFTFSMHGQNNFPFKKEHSDWDIGIEDGTNGKEYLYILSDALQSLPKIVQPDFIFYQAGVDVLSTDKMGKLNLSIEDCKQRDKLVFNFCKQQNAPIEVSMGGGYSPSIGVIVDAHCNTYKTGIDVLLY